MGYIFDAMNRIGSGRPKKRSAIDPPLSPPPGEAPSPDVLGKLTPQSAADPAAPPQPTEYGGQRDEPTDDAYPNPPAENKQQPSSHQLKAARIAGPAGQLAPASIGLDIQVDDYDDRLVALTEPASLMSEEYRAIRTGMLARWEHKRNLVHTITSATPQEGKTITSLNLGLSFAELRNRRTIVVEADLRLPQFNKLIGVDSDLPGMVGLLDGSQKLADVVYEIGPTNLHMIFAGGRANDQAVQLLHSSRLVTLLQQLRNKYDHVIIDTPPVVELADAGIIGAMSDDVQLIVRMGRTPRPLVEQAIRTLQSYSAPVAGLIATDQTRHRGRYYYKYGYKYRYRYRYTDRKAA